MAAPDEAQPRPRYSPEQVLKQLSEIPEDKRTFSAAKLLQALTSQLETLTAMKALQQNKEAVTMAEIGRIIMLFLKNIYNLVSGLPGALMFDALEDVIARSGILTPFINGMGKADETIVLELGLPSNDVLCDNHEELIRIASAAVVCFYHYTNYPAHPAYFPSDDATLLFTTLALRSCQDRTTAEALAVELQAAGDLISLAEIRWLMHYFRAQLSGLGGAVYLSMGDMQKHKQHLVAQQADFLGLLKAVPENPAGYIYYVRSCLQFQQLSAAGLFASKGSVVAAKHHSPFYGAQLAAQRAIALALAGGGSSSTGGGGGAAAAAAAAEVSAAAKAAAAKAAAAAGDAGAPPPEAAAAAAAAPPALVRAGELRSLVDTARAGLLEEREALPEAYGDLVDLDPVDSKLLDEKLGPMLQGVPDEGEVLALTDQLYPTRPPAALPRGAVAIGKP